MPYDECHRKALLFTGIETSNACNQGTSLTGFMLQFLAKGVSNRNPRSRLCAGVLDLYVEYSLGIESHWLRIMHLHD